MTETAMDGRRVLRISRKSGGATAQVLFLHGGGYVYEMMPAQWRMLAEILKRVNVEITVPLYPLAPDATVEEVLPFVRAVYEELAGKGQMPDALLGDSSGGGMCVALSQTLRDEKRPMPARLLLISPWLDVTCSDPEQEEREKLDPLLSLAALRKTGQWYAGRIAVSDARVSPLYGDLKGLPPAVVFSGTHDVLHADALRLVRELRDKPGAVTLRVYARMLHVWVQMPISEAKQALDEIAHSLQTSVHGSG